MSGNKKVLTAGVDGQNLKNEHSELSISMSQ